MARTVSLTVLVGYLGKDPEIKQVNGKSVAVMSVATSERYKSGNDWKTSTEWHRVVAWGVVADLVADLGFQKGEGIHILGRNQTRTYDDPAGGKERSITEVIAKEIFKLAPAPKSSGSKPQKEKIPF